MNSRVHPHSARRVTSRCAYSGVSSSLGFKTRTNDPRVRTPTLHDPDTGGATTPTTPTTRRRQIETRDACARLRRRTSRLARALERSSIVARYPGTRSEGRNRDTNRPVARRPERGGLRASCVRSAFHFHLERRLASSRLAWNDGGRDKSPSA